MFAINRLKQVFESSPEIEISNSSKMILMSDVHRGTKSWADNFANNVSIYDKALSYYLNEGFTYIEIGDGDELWENKFFSEILTTYGRIFEILNQFHIRNRLYLIFGNHDIEKRNKKFIKKNSYLHYNYCKQKYEPLFYNIKYYEGLILKYSYDNKIFLVHGHQGDILNDLLWKIARFLVRYIWRPLEIYFGFKDPTSAAKNYKKKRSTEKRIADWANLNKQMIITGHTHRPMFPTNNDSIYYNTGSCVHPNCITGIEIENGEMKLVRWCKSNKDELGIIRVVMSDSKKLHSLYK